jgi:Ca-activated chloride channel family protein
VIALDVSNSMLAKDVAPSRLEQAKKFVQRLTAALDGERLGLIFFAGEAYAQMPLSTDYEALMMFVRNAQPDFITDQGTDIGAAVALAERMLETGKSAGRAIILVSDGENHEEAAMQRVREAQESGIVLYTVSVGSAGGTTIPAGRGAFRRDFSGQPVRTSANESLMLSLAQAGGGQSFSLKEEDRAIEGLKLGVAQLRKSAVEAGATEQKVYYFPWLLLAALAFLLLEQVLWWRKP